MAPHFMKSFTLHKKPHSIIMIILILSALPDIYRMLCANNGTAAVF